MTLGKLRNDAPFWSDDFDMDLPKIIPEARDIVGDLSDLELWTIGNPDRRLGNLNHPCVWNGDATMLAYFGIRSPYVPGGMVAPGSQPIRCTVWQAFRDAWPHSYLMHVERRPIWDTFALRKEFDDIMFDLRGWDRRPEKAKRGRDNTRASLGSAVKALRRLISERHEAQERDETK